MILAANQRFLRKKTIHWLFPDLEESFFSRDYFLTCGNHPNAKIRTVLQSMQYNWLGDERKCSNFLNCDVPQPLLLKTNSYHLV